VEILEANDVHLVVLAGFLYVLAPSFFRVYQNRVLNVHPSLIPSFCGAGFYGLRVHRAALDFGVKLTGATVHFVNEETDGGPIILQKSIDILPGDTPETLQRRVMEQAEWQLLPEAVRLYCEDRLRVEGRRVLIRDDGDYQI
jgi:phosphoribosylglycinamide formyltransferase-1